MIPMVHSLDQILWIKQELQNVRDALASQGLRHTAHLPLGIMVEVPSVCFIIDHFCEEVDFFSIGSNDMTQYLYAVDRNNPRVSGLYNPITPSFYAWFARSSPQRIVTGNGSAFAGSLAESSATFLFCLGWA